MTTASELPHEFRHVRLLLAREHDHPGGERGTGYDLLMPLDASGRLDAAAWKRSQVHCRVRRFNAGGTDRLGRLRRKPGGQWYIDYSVGESDDEIGFHFGDERFVTGEYVSIGARGRTHTYQVARVERP